MSAGGDEIHDAVVEFVRTSLPRVSPDDIGSGTPLIANGLDSIAVLELVTFLSERLSFEMEDSDFVASNFETVGDLVSMIECKRSSVAATE
jgi:acyl carrier protein